MCIIKEPTSGVWCPQTILIAGGNKKGDLGEIPPSVLPTAHLFCPADDQGMPTGASRNSPTSAAGGRREGVMSLGCQHKVRLKPKVLGPFSLGAMGCAAPSEVLGFAACRSRHHLPGPPDPPLTHS